MVGKLLGHRHAPVVVALAVLAFMCASWFLASWTTALFANVLGAILLAGWVAVQAAITEMEDDDD